MKRCELRIIFAHNLSPLIGVNSVPKLIDLMCVHSIWVLSDLSNPFHFINEKAEAQKEQVDLLQVSSENRAGDKTWVFWLSALWPLSFISVFCAVFKNELTHTWASLCLWKIQCLNRKLSLRDLSPACEASLWMGPIVSLSFELGTMGALLRVSWSNLTSFPLFHQRSNWEWQLEALRVCDLCWNPEGGDCQLLLSTLEFAEKHKISYEEKHTLEFMFLCMLKYGDLPCTCMLA